MQHPPTEPVERVLCSAPMVGASVGSYKIIRPIGEGGMGAVYLGTHSILGRPAAIKVLLPALSQRPEIVGRLFNEARAATAIRHPGIVEIYDFGHLPDGSAYIAMEFLEGESLTSRLARAGRLSVSATIEISRQIAAALHAAHSKGITHRDLKPDNVFLVPDPEIGERVKLLDFGIAKLATEEPGGTRTRTGVVLGTPVYMSPEQCRGASTLDGRADLYSLGCMLYELLAGRPVFNADSAGDIIAHHLYFQPEPVRMHEPSVPEPLEQLIHALLAKDPAMRPATAGDVVAVLDQWRAWNVVPSATTALSIAAVSLPHSYPGHPGAHPGPTSGGRGTHPSAPPGPGAQPGTYPRLAASMPTTLSGSAMSIAGPPGAAAAPRSGSKRMRWFVAVAALAAAVGIAVIVVTRREQPAPAMAAPTAPTSPPVAAPAPPSAATRVAPSEAPPTPSAPAAPPQAQRAEPSQAPASVPATETAPPPAPADDEPARPATTAHGQPGRGADEPRAASPAALATATAKKKSAKRGDPAGKTASVAVVTPTPAAPAEPEVAPPAPPPPPPATAQAEPAVAPPPSPAPPSPGSLDAVSSIASISVDGPLPDSEIRSTVERALGTFRECYRSAARQASKTPALRVTLSFVIDEGRAARSVRVGGDTLGLGACVKDAASKIRTRVAPDVGTATVHVVVKFQPTGG
jgi:serine/threonine-protein kinase